MKTLIFSCLMVMSFWGSSQCACCDTLHQQFSFWEGDWTVYDSTNKVIGHNTITIQEDSCVMREQWRGAGGSTGISINYYNRKDKLWHQHWVDNYGGVLDLKGGLINNTMILSSDPTPGQNGKLNINRVIWTPVSDKEVIQEWMVSQDGGSTWTTIFLGFYRK